MSSTPIVCRALSRNIHLYSIGRTLPTEPKPPLVIFFPWLLAKDSAVRKFVSLYHSFGADVLVARGKAKHFLAPRSGRVFAAELERCLLESSKENGMGEGCLDCLDRKIFLHGTSVGAYLLTLFQMRLTENRTFERVLGDRVKGQIMDSIVFGGVDRMITGVVDNLVRPSFLKQASRSVIGSYFRAFHGSTLEFYASSIEYYRTRLALTPILFVYCDNDSLCDAEMLRTSLLPQLSARGHRISVLHLPESTHAAHYYRHPKEYSGALEKFLADCLLPEESCGVSAKL